MGAGLPIKSLHLSNLFQGRLGEVAQNQATSYRHGHANDSHRGRVRVCMFVKAVTIRCPCPCFTLSLIFTARYLIESFLCRTAQVVDSLFFMRDYRIFYKMIPHVTDAHNPRTSA